MDSQDFATGLSTDDKSSPVNKSKPDCPAVRFASTNQEIEPGSVDNSKLKLSEGAEAELRALSSTLNDTTLKPVDTKVQEQRMGRYTFEPVSLPVSRVNSREDHSHETSRQNTRGSSGRNSPHENRRSALMHTPPLTPAASGSKDPDAIKGQPLQKVEAEDDIQISPLNTGQSSVDKVSSSRPDSAGNLSTRPTSVSADSVEGVKPAVHHGKFSIGPKTHSVPASRDQSPSRTPGSPMTYSRPITPAGDLNDPYAANKRPPQPKNLDAIEPRFVFSGLNSRSRQNTSSSTNNLPRSSKSGTDLSTKSDKRSSFLGGAAAKTDPSLSHLHDGNASLQSKHGSMAELKRFLKFGGHHKAKRAASPTPSSKSGFKTPPHHKTPGQLPFDDTHGINARYGKFGKVLGAGAGGSVRLMKRSSDGVTFAVKEFRAKHSYENEKDYGKKVTAEFCIGSSLHHCNIIETLDIINEKGKWYEVMEYAPYDLFAIVMTGKMSREEVTCSFLQILSGTSYLHSVGLAHRDLKLDNVVVNEHGIMKIIDFGSASVFQYPFENEVVLATGIVGSDPYLAPEVYDEKRYDPRPTDIWSLAIIYCCMTLRRFPWKLPRMSDNSYKLFASPPSPETDIRRSSHNASNSKSTGDVPAEGHPDHSTPAAVEHPHPHPEVEEEPKVELKKVNTALVGPVPETPKPEVIKGPWRLLRLMPRESRHIIGRMLELDPRMRATMKELLDDPWVADTEICRQEAEGHGAVIRAPGHTHTLEPPAGVGATTGK